MTPLVASRLLRLSVAFVWLFTGLAVLHPYYRLIGHTYLQRLGLPDSVMYATCGFEVLLGLRVALGPASGWLTLLQVAMVSAFTVILACLEPSMLLHPFGMLTKNVPLLAVVVTAWLLEREGWTPRTTWLLRGGLATIWITEGLLPKVVWIQDSEIEVVRRSGLVPIDEVLFLHLLGGALALSGVLALVLRGGPLRAVLAAQLVALVVLPVLVSLPEPTLWVHPFGPMTKNVPLLAGTAVLLLRTVPSGLPAVAER